jgi:hypothetical protein
MNAVPTRIPYSMMMSLCRSKSGCSSDSPVSREQHRSMLVDDDNNNKRTPWAWLILVDAGIAFCFVCRHET